MGWLQLILYRCNGQVYKIAGEGIRQRADGLHGDCFLTVAVAEVVEPCAGPCRGGEAVSASICMVELLLDSLIKSVLWVFV